MKRILILCLIFLVIISHCTAVCECTKPDTPIKPVKTIMKPQTAKSIQTFKFPNIEAGIIALKNMQTSIGKTSMSEVR